jgi:CheY-like chemotaxis protein
MNTEKPFVLLIEDNPADVNLIEEAFAEAQLDCDLSILRSGAQAIDLINGLDSGSSSRCPDLVLLDLNLPKVSGEKVLERVRSSANCRAAEVLIISSSNAPSDRDRIEKLGAVGYFQKPSSLEQFMTLGPKVRALLEGLKARKQPPASLD